MRKGDRVKVTKIKADDDAVREHVECFLDREGIIEDDPTWLPLDPDAGPLGRVVAEGECVVRFADSCDNHGENWAIFTVAELEAVPAPGAL